MIILLNLFISLMINKVNKSEFLYHNEIHSIQNSHYTTRKSQILFYLSSWVISVSLKCQTMGNVTSILDYRSILEFRNKNKYSNIYAEFAFKHNGPIRPQNICCVNQERYDISQIYHVARYFTITYISIK